MLQTGLVIIIKQKYDVVLSRILQLGRDWGFGYRAVLAVHMSERMDPFACSR